MKLGKALTWFSIFSVAIFMMVVITLVPPRNLLQSGTTIVEDTARVTQGFQRFLVRKLGKGFSGLGMEESAREVPTGPDPLHHKNKPTRP